MNTNTVLNVKDLCKTYIVNKRQNNVLKNVNFTVSEGEMVAIMGFFMPFRGWTVSLPVKWTSVERILLNWVRKNLQVLGLMKWDLSFNRCIC